MPNKESSQLTIDGKTWTLTYDFNRIADAEDVAGCNLLAALERLSSMNAQQLRGLLYAAIVDVPRPPLAEVGAMIRVNTIAPITTALAEAYRLTLPDEEPETEVTQ